MRVKILASSESEVETGLAVSNDIEVSGSGIMGLCGCTSAGQRQTQRRLALGRLLLSFVSNSSGSAFSGSTDWCSLSSRSNQVSGLVPADENDQRRSREIEGVTWWGWLREIEGVTWWDG